MSDISQQIENIQKILSDTPHHKATDHYIGRLRAKLSHLKEKQLESFNKKSGGMGYAVKKQGDATVVLVGPPSVGKSTLLNLLTNAKSKIAPYEFTTVNVIPGMMEYNNAKIQILDVPGLIKGAEEGKGRGREVLSVIRGSDLLLIITEEGKSTFLSLIKTLEKNGIRINKDRPNIIIEKKVKGGIVIHSNIQQDITKETMKEIINEMGIKNGEITIKEKVTIDSLIDALSKNRVYVPALFVKNKIDLYSKEKNPIDQTISISAKHNIGIEKLKEEIYKQLNFINVYLIKPNEKSSKENPIVVKNNQTLKEIGENISEEFIKDKTKALIWGKGSKFPGQEASLSTKVEDGMQIRFV